MAGGAWIPREEIHQNPFGEQCTDEYMQTLLDEIGTLEQWTTKYGQMFNHDTRVIQMVMLLVTEGVKEWDFEPTMEQVNIIYPGTTPATWWILMNASENTDKKLYYKLATCVEQFYPLVWNEETTRAWAKAYLQAVHDEMTEEGMQEMREHMWAYDALALGAGRIDG